MVDVSEILLYSSGFLPLQKDDHSDPVSQPRSEIFTHESPHESIGVVVDPTAYDLVDFRDHKP